MIWSSGLDLVNRVYVKVPYYYYYYINNNNNNNNNNHFLLFWSVLHQLTLMVFHWSLSDSKSPQVSRTLLSILSVFNNAVVWMVSTRPPTFNSSLPFNNPLVIVPKAPITIGTIVTFMFHSFFNSLTRSRYLSFFSHSFSFILWSARIDNFANSLFCGWLLYGLVYWPRLGDLSAYQSPIGVYACHF